MARVVEFLFLALFLCGCESIPKTIAANNRKCYPAIFAFGDSLVDRGNERIVHPGSRPFLHNETYMSAPRDTVEEGGLIIDFLAQGVGLPSPNPYMESTTPNFTYGVNLGTFAATASAIGFINAYNLQIQSYWIQRFRSNVLNALNSTRDVSKALPQPEDFENGLYVFAIGGNDYTAAYMVNNYSMSLYTSSNRSMIAMPRVVIEALNQTIMGLISNGAKNFLIMNVPPLGCSTMIKEFFNLKNKGLIIIDGFDDMGCVKYFNKVIDRHNTLLKELLRGYRLEFPHMTFICADYNAAIQSLMSRSGVSSSDVGNRECPAKEVAGCYGNNLLITSENVNRLVVRAFFSGQFLEPALALRNCQVDSNLP